MWISVWKATKSDAVHGKHYRRGASEPLHVPRCHLVDVPLYQVFQLPQSVTPTSWILDTHYAFLEQRSTILRTRKKGKIQKSYDQKSVFHACYPCEGFFEICS